MLDPCRHTGRELDGSLLAPWAMSASDNAENRLSIFERNLALIPLGCNLSPGQYNNPNERSRRVG